MMASITHTTGGFVYKGLFSSLPVTLKYEDIRTVDKVTYLLL